MPGRNVERIELFRRKALANGAVTLISDGLPLGEGWRKLIYRFEVALTVGTGTGAISEGELRYIKGISVSTDKGEKPYDNVPSRLLYRRDSIIQKTPAAKDAIAAASATYVVEIPVWFYNPLLSRPNDTILDTSRYKSITLGVQLGTVADLLSSVGTATVSTTLTVYLERTRKPLEAHERPRFMLEVGMPAPVNPANSTEIPFEMSDNLAYSRFFLFTSNSATAGVPFSGDANSAVISELTLETSKGNPFDRVLSDVVNRENKQDYSLAAVITGMYILDLLRENDIGTALFSGPSLLSRLKMKWVNDTLSTSQVSCGYEGFRSLVA